MKYWNKGKDAEVKNLKEVIDLESRDGEDLKIELDLESNIKDSSE